MATLERSTRPWARETGHLDQGMLARYLGDLAGPIYYIVGPPGLVDAMRRLLSAADIETADTRLNKFAGY